MHVLLNVTKNAIVRSQKNLSEENDFYLSRPPLICMLVRICFKCGANNTTPVRARGNGQRKYLILPILSPFLVSSSRLNFLFPLRDSLCYTRITSIMSQTADSSNLKTPDRLNTEYLARHGISYEPNPEAKSDLPEHVAYLKSALLDFDCTVSHRLDLHDDILDIRHFQLDNAFQRLHIEETEEIAIQDSVKRYKKVQESAHWLIQCKESEDKWHKLYEGHFFARLVASVEPCDTDTRR